MAAVDLGASSGRVMLGEVGPDSVALREIHRFGNGPVRVGDTLHWDVLGIHREVLAGLRAAGPLDGVGVDSWAVDYGLLDERGALLGNPVCYRDARTDGVAAALRATVPPAEQYAVTGLRELPFNTIYQLVSERDGARLRAASTMLLVPDLLGYWLTGQVGAERTNASTTGLYDATRGEWALDLARRAGIPTGLLPRLRDAGEILGPTTPAVSAELGHTAPVVAVGSHDTASAVLGVPATGDVPFAFISSGTWSLVGMELSRPLLTEPARAAGFSNESGVDGTVRLLRNVTGLWVLTESVRAWGTVSLADALAAARDAPAFGPVVDIDDPVFLPPGDMPARIAAACRATGQRPPEGVAEITRCVLESLALAYRRAVRRLGEVTGRPAEVIHLIGGGTHNEFLCQLTADACGLPVVAGPVEATALGNVLVQARALGADLPDRWAMRALVARTVPTRTHTPGPGADRWDGAEARYAALGV
ncbi:rhamnulokinase [Actinophytocola xinjiangensis]|uniref:Rhamnulokinase n=2 Tax=Actinophytocola xinjiangensis TaxID=485602 RepID=A0A7Z1B0F0_9PSEU|nr:rhamnulokinase [Actinophytocola xinjiangensis]